MFPSCSHSSRRESRLHCYNTLSAVVHSLQVAQVFFLCIFFANATGPSSSLNISAVNKAYTTQHSFRKLQTKAWHHQTNHSVRWGRLWTGMVSGLHLGVHSEPAVQWNVSYRRTLTLEAMRRYSRYIEKAARSDGDPNVDHKNMSLVITYMDQFAPTHLQMAQLQHKNERLEWCTPAQLCFPQCVNELTLHSLPGNVKHLPAMLVRVSSL